VTVAEVALAPVPRITVDALEAAGALGVSRGFFLATIAPELRVIRRGRRKLYRIAELERWAEANEARVFE
jgi:hypothetical protein